VIVRWALLGSGEFEPWSVAVDRWMLERASGRGPVLILPTASAPEGDEVFERWGAMGVDHFGRMEVRSEVLPLKTSADAQRADLVERLDGASMVYFSGGNPAYLASTLAGSAFWNRLLERMGEGLAYTGCSGGVACLGTIAPDAGFRHMTPDLWRPGLGVFPSTVLAPHWDTVEAFVPGLRRFVLEAVPPGGRLVGLDERTALVGDGVRWTVIGEGGIHVNEDGGWRSVRAPESAVIDLGAHPVEGPAGSGP
jgi:cyanophycinase